MAHEGLAIGRLRFWWARTGRRNCVDFGGREGDSTLGDGSSRVGASTGGVVTATEASCVMFAADPAATTSADVGECIDCHFSISAPPTPPASTKRPKCNGFISRV
jgi:hypothetical protein